METKKIKKFNKELLIKLKSLSEKLIDQSRNHLVQLCLISGVIAAFLMPIYASQDFSLMQHFLISLSLVCFLLSILIGCLYLSFKMLEEQRNITEMIDIIEKQDFDRGDKFQIKHNKPLKWRNSIDIKMLMVDILFSFGIIFIIFAIICTENNWLN